MLYLMTIMSMMVIFLILTGDNLISVTFIMVLYSISIIISISTERFPTMIKLGTQVQHKLHDDLNGDVVQLNRKSNTATVKYWIDDYEPMLVSVYLSDLEVA